MVFFNLAAVVDHPCAAAVSLCLFAHVNRVMMDPALLARPKVLGLDEGWALMRDRASAELVEKAVRLAQGVGRQIATVEETRKIFNLP